MISVLAPLRSRGAARIAQIMVSPWAAPYLLGSSLGECVLRLLFTGASCMAQGRALKSLSCQPNHGAEAN